MWPVVQGSVTYKRLDTDTFKLEEKQESPFLPVATGPLSIVVASSTIEAANKVMKHV